MATKVRDLEKKDDKKKPEASKKPTLKQRSDQRKQRQMQQLEGTMAPIESRVGGLEMDTASVGVPASAAEGSSFNFASQKNAPAQTQATETAGRGDCGPDGCGVSGQTGTAVTLPPLPNLSGTAVAEPAATGEPAATAEPAPEQPQGEAPAESEASTIVTTPAASFAQQDIEAGADPVATISEARQIKTKIGGSALGQLEADMGVYQAKIDALQGWMASADEPNNRNQSNWGVFDGVRNQINSFRARIGQLETSRIQILYDQQQTSDLDPLVQAEANLTDATAMEVSARADAIIAQLPENVKARTMENGRELFNLVRSGDMGSGLLLSSIMKDEQFNNLSATNPAGVQQNVANAQPGEDGGAGEVIKQLVPQTGASNEMVQRSMAGLDEATSTIILGGTLARMKDAAEMSTDETARFGVYSDSAQTLAGFYVNKAMQEDPTLAQDSPEVASNKIYQRFGLELDAFTTGDAERQAGELLREDPTLETGAVRGHFMTPAAILKKSMPNFILEQVKMRQAPVDQSPVTRYFGSPTMDDPTPRYR